MSQLPLILFAAGSIMSAVGKAKQGVDASAASKYNAQVAGAEAKSIQESAAFESATLEKQSELEQFKIRQAKKSTLSTQRALTAKSGIRIFEGSPLEVQAATAAQYEMDLSANRYNLAIDQERLRYESQTAISRKQSEAEYLRGKAKQQKTAGFVSAGSTLLSSVGTYGLLSPKTKG